MTPYWIVLAAGEAGDVRIFCNSLRDTGRTRKTLERFGFVCTVLERAGVAA
jgi:hypothetical protein